MIGEKRPILIIQEKGWYCLPLFLYPYLENYGRGVDVV